MSGVLIRPPFRWGVGGGAAIRSLAVLPLENLSRDPEQEYFADGMTEELITSLANVEGVRVISRTSVMRYKGTNKTIPQIARELNVDVIVEGSVLRAGDEVRITAQLIEASSDRHLWAKSYQRDVSHVLALQGEVAQAIATEVGAALTQRGREQPLFRRGTGLARRRIPRTPGLCCGDHRVVGGRLAQWVDLPP